MFGTVRLALADQDDMFETWQAFAERSHLFLVKRGGRDQKLALADPDPGGDWFWPEGREQGRGHSAGLERAKYGDVEFGHPAQQGDDARSGCYAESLERIGEAVRLVSKIPVSQVAPRLVFANPAQGDLVRCLPSSVAVDRLVGDVAAPTVRQTVRPIPGLRPAKSPAFGRIVQQIRHGNKRGRLLSDTLPFFRHHRPCVAHHVTSLVWRHHPCNWQNLH